MQKLNEIFEYNTDIFEKWLSNSVTRIEKGPVASSATFQI